MKIKISKEEYEKLSDEMKAQYKVDGDAYKLDVDDSEVAAEMRRAKDREVLARQDAEKRAKELEEKLAEIQGDNARKSGDIETIERSWKEKLDKQKDEFTKKEALLKKQLETNLVENAIKDIAAEIFLKPGRDSRLIKDRVYVDYDGETPIVRVRDAEGKASAMSIEELKKEILDNKDYSDILVGSKASGSGGTGGNQGAGGSKQPSDYTEAERIHLYNTNRPEFNRLFNKSA